MLPDYPNIKSEISEALEIFFRNRVEQYAYPIKNVPKSRIYEGQSSVIIRKSGKKDKTKMIKSEATMETRYDEVGKLTITDILKKLDRAAFDFAKQMVDGFYKSLSEILEAAGQTVNHKGVPLSPEILLKTFEKTFIPFDENGKPELPEIHIGPDLHEAMQKAYIELNTDPDLKRKFNDLILQKGEEWRAEQASRKLVG